MIFRWCRPDETARAVDPTLPDPDESTRSSGRQCSDDLLKSPDSASPVRRPRRKCGIEWRGGGSYKWSPVIELKGAGYSAFGKPERASTPCALRHRLVIEAARRSALLSQPINRYRAVLSR